MEKTVEKAKAATTRTQQAGVDGALAALDLMTEMGEQMERFTRAQTGHATQQARELNELVSGISAAAIEAAAKSRKQGLDLARALINAN
ncbi:MAG: hypothetical protein AB7N76_13645 [Planctomycetota bacterium]